MLTAPMTVNKIVPVHGVVIFPMMNAVFVVVMIRAALTVQVYQMAVTL